MTMPAQSSARSWQWQTRHWRLMSRTTGTAGLAGLVLVFGAQGLIQIGGAEPAFDASAEEAWAFFQARDPVLFAAGSYLSVVGMLVVLWFTAGLCAVLRQTEGEPAWRSTVALASGILFAAPALTGAWELAGFRAGEGLEPQGARLAFDLGHLGLANSLVALASFLAATGWIMVARWPFPSWLGWWAIVTAVCFLAARVLWATSWWILPFVLFWLWEATVSVLLLRGRLGREQEAAELGRHGT